jgi:hypothetical protein
MTRERVRCKLCGCDEFVDVRMQRAAWWRRIVGAGERRLVMRCVLCKAGWAFTENQIALDCAWHISSKRFVLVPDAECAT